MSQKDQAVLRQDRSLFEPQLDFVPAAAFAAAFKESAQFRETRARLDVPFDKKRSHPAALLQSKFGTTGWDAVKTLTWRQGVLLGRNKTAQTYRYIQMFVLAATLSTLFLRGEVAQDEDLRVRPPLRSLPS